jgi:hypothetical protein
MPEHPVLFLSHSGLDTETARELKRRLLSSPDAKEAGLEIWFDKDDLLPGQGWQEQLEKVIATGSEGPSREIAIMREPAGERDCIRDTQHM